MRTGFVLLSDEPHRNVHVRFKYWRGCDLFSVRKLVIVRPWEWSCARAVRPPPTDRASVLDFNHALGGNQSLAYGQKESVHRLML